MSPENKPILHSLRNCYIAAGFISLMMFVLFVYLGYTRNVDGDEGLYLEAIRLVMEGKKLYLDFFYQQMPLLPYLYAGWMKIFGFDLYAARWFSALLTALTGLTLLIYTARRTQSLLMIHGVAFLFYASGIVLAWAPVIKTHVFNMFFLTLSTVLLLEWRKSSRRSLWMVAAASLAIGIGFNERLLLAPFVLAHFLFVLLSGSPHRLKSAAIYLLGIFLTSLPTFYYYFSDPHRFIQLNFLYHTQIYPGIADWPKRWEIARNVFLQPQILLIMLISQWSVVLKAKERGRKFFLSDEFYVEILLWVFIAAHMASAEPFSQYFSAMIPLVLLLCIPFFEKLFTFPKIASAIAVIFLFSFYLAYSKKNIHFEIHYVGSDDAYWNLRKLEKSVEAVKAIVKPDEYCLTWWPGYAFMAGCRSAPGMENHMRNHAQVRVSGEVLESYLMMSEERVIDVLSSQKYPVVIDGVYRISSPFTPKIDRLLQENYSLINEVEGVKIYVAKRTL